MLFRSLWLKASIITLKLTIFGGFNPCSERFVKLCSSISLRVHTNLSNLDIHLLLKWLLIDIYVLVPLLCPSLEVNSRSQLLSLLSRLNDFNYISLQPFPFKISDIKPVEKSGRLKWISTPLLDQSMRLPVYEFIKPVRPPREMDFDLLSFFLNMSRWYDLHLLQQSLHSTICYLCPDSQLTLQSRRCISLHLSTVPASISDEKVEHPWIFYSASSLHFSLANSQQTTLSSS